MGSTHCMMTLQMSAQRGSLEEKQKCAREKLHHAGMVGKVTRRQESAPLTTLTSTCYNVYTCVIITIILLVIKLN